MVADETQHFTERLFDEQHGHGGEMLPFEREKKKECRKVWKKKRVGGILGVREWNYIHGRVWRCLIGVVWGGDKRGKGGRKPQAKEEDGDEGAVRTRGSQRHQPIGKEKERACGCAEVGVNYK